jgi:hypothetical protein
MELAQSAGLSSRGRYATGKTVVAFISQRPPRPGLQKTGKAGLYLIVTTQLGIEVVRD